MYCDRCGKYVVVSGQVDYANCEDCEQDYQDALAEQYPLGQCYTCGAEYRKITCKHGTKVIIASHEEGGCDQWRDSEYIEWCKECTNEYDNEQRAWYTPSATVQSDDLPF